MTKSPEDFTPKEHPSDKLINEFHDAWGKEQEDLRAEASRWWQEIENQGAADIPIKINFKALYPKTERDVTIKNRIPLNTTDEEAQPTTEEITPRELKDAGLMISNGVIVSNGEGWAGDMVFGELLEKDK